MRRRIAIVGATLAACALAAGIGAGALAADPGGRTVTAGNFTVEWSATNPEDIVSLSWNGSPNLTNTWVHPFCPQGGDHEFFGNAWDAFNDFQFRTLVGWGTTGTWDTQGSHGVRIASADQPTCFGASAIPVDTRYQFYDQGATVNRILVQRRIAFGSTPFTFDLRPYIPRLYPRSTYTTVIHPNAAGTALVTEIGDTCEFGCQVTDWDGSWFAVHAPSTGSGMIVRHAASADPVALWVDVDGGSFTTATSVELLQPPGGFTGTVVENEFLCFYDASLWTPSLQLPAGC